ncbi:Uma2 family endonuclease [Yinghuangia sp. YIM S09857]|uniref:Uma2 family endonuclease n=1 Tax=Yinghuangia sp. YIM S09857 TaxID=3436929 RepID=UPI003F5395A6
MTIMVERHVNIPELLDDLDAADGFRVEYVEGGFTVTPPPSQEHEDIAGNLLKQLNRADLAHVYPAGRAFCLGNGCSDAEVGNHVVPDASVAAREFTPEERRQASLHKNWIIADALDLVVEITSTNRKNDLKDKLIPTGARGFRGV